MEVFLNLQKDIFTSARKGFSAWLYELCWKCFWNYFHLPSVPLSAIDCYEYV
jgi:deoxyribodipyrimidine photolyase